MPKRIRTPTSSWWSTPRSSTGSTRAGAAQLRGGRLNGEVVSPPAGAIGRGDAFVLRIAERTGAVVLSNDSFQEFHGEHPWLFDDGRLIGGKPVPGWDGSSPRACPIRGPKSRGPRRRRRAGRDPSLLRPRRPSWPGRRRRPPRRRAEEGHCPGRRDDLADHAERAAPVTRGGDRRRSIPSCRAPSARRWRRRSTRHRGDGGQGAGEEEGRRPRRSAERPRRRRGQEGAKPKKAAAKKRRPRSRPRRRRRRPKATKATKSRGQTAPKAAAKKARRR